MKSLTILSISLSFLVIFSGSCLASGSVHDDFLRCLNLKSNDVSSISYTPNNPSYSSLLRSSIRNLRFATETTPKPVAIVAPVGESQVPPVIHCAKENGLQIRTRGAGHDYEGLSYTSHQKTPFVLLDLVNLSEVIVDAEEKTAWVQGGATLGQVYYGTAEKSQTLGFPAGVCPTVGVGGHISGGGYGPMMRKYGIAADQVIDARMVDVNGRLLDRNSMGEDLFWAIRGGGGASFGVILAWKLKVVDVPETVTFFIIRKTVEQGAIDLAHRWQYAAPKLDKDLTMFLQVRRNGTGPVYAEFVSLFLGGIDRLLQLMEESFSELNLTREDCTEMSWIKSTLSFANNAGYPGDDLGILLNRTEPRVPTFKSKSDYVQKPIPKEGIEGMWRLLSEPEIDQAALLIVPYGGRMAEISESAIPFPHRAGNLFKLNSNVYWQEDDKDSGKYISWIRRFESYMTPYVTKFPRAAYINYRDLDLGVNNPNGNTSYAEASIWGKKYFKNNFDRLVKVKTKVDPTDFFRNEQSIPPLHGKPISVTKTNAILLGLLLIFVVKYYFL